MSGRVIFLTGVAITGTVLYVLLVGALHFLRPDLNPVTHYESEYGNGSYSVLMTLAFLLRALLTFAVALALAIELRDQPGLVWTEGLLAVYTIGALLLAIFPADIAGSHRTLHGEVHDLVALVAFTCVAFAPFALGRVLRRDSAWGRFAPLNLLFGAAMLASFLLLGVVMRLDAAGTILHVGGLTERIFIALTLAWLLLLALQLRSQHTRVSARG